MTQECRCFVDYHLNYHLNDHLNDHLGSVGEIGSVGENFHYHIWGVRSTYDSTRPLLRYFFVILFVINYLSSLFLFRYFINYSLIIILHYRHFISLQQL